MRSSLAAVFALSIMAGCASGQTGSADCVAPPSSCECQFSGSIVAGEVVSVDAAARTLVIAPTWISNLQHLDGDTQPPLTLTYITAFECAGERELVLEPGMHVLAFIGGNASADAVVTLDEPEVQLGASHSVPRDMLELMLDRAECEAVYPPPPYGGCRDTVEVGACAAGGPQRGSPYALLALAAAVAALVRRRGARHPEGDHR